VALVVSKKLSKNDLIRRSVWSWEQNQSQQNTARITDKITDEEFANILKTNSLHLYDMAYQNAHISTHGDIDFDIIFGNKENLHKDSKKKSQKKNEGTASLSASRIL